MFQHQLRCLSTAIIRIAGMGAVRPQVQGPVVSGFSNLWFEKNDRQRVLWSPTVRLSQEYFDSLKQYAVALNESALAALAHTAICLDIYCWLAQRLHRVDPRRPSFIAWTTLKDQFGPDYRQLFNF